MKTARVQSLDALTLGFGSIATQTVFIKLILSSELGGELYAAMAIGGWIASVASGAFWGRKIKSDRRAIIWALSAIIKIPLAFFVFIYPSFFTGILDPLRFLPLLVLGIAPTGILYGLLFPLLIDKTSKTSTVYRNEAIGSLGGGLLTMAYSYAGTGGFALLFFLAGVEISRAVSRRLFALSIPAVCLIGGFFIGPLLDRAGLGIRWPGFKTVKSVHGYSGLWAIHERENQLTISHNGGHLQTIPDRQLSEEALLWPFVYNPDARDVLLIGFEGFEIGKYLPENVHATVLVGDKGYLKLEPATDSEYSICDPLSYETDLKYDIINVYYKGGAGLGDNRFETDFFIKKCKKWLKSGGVFYVSAVSDENYIAPELCRYLSAIKSTLDANFNFVSPIPGPRIGFICRTTDKKPNLAESLNALKIDSPYFNQRLIANRMAHLRTAYLETCFNEGGAGNDILRPKSIISYLKWIASMFGKGRYFFQIYIFPYPLLLFPMLILVPLLIRISAKTDFMPVFTVTLLGATGLTAEIVVLYLFQILFGHLYLHIGLIIALFMGGMALGAHMGGKLKFLFFTIPFLIALIPFLFLRSAIESAFGLNSVLFLLFMLATVSGFFSGGGFAALSGYRPDSRSVGATLYGADLYGAMAAAVMVPGILIVFGVDFIFRSLVIIALIISATLWYLRR